MTTNFRGVERITCAVCAVIALVLRGAALAAAHRDEAVYRAVEADRAGALDLLKSVVNIDSGTGDVAGGWKRFSKRN